MLSEPVDPGILISGIKYQIEDHKICKALTHGKMTPVLLHTNVSITVVFYHPRQITGTKQQ